VRHPAKEQIIKFYTEVLGLATAGEIDRCTEIAAEPMRLFVEAGEPRDIVLELIVANLDHARRELEAAGCRVMRWEGRGKDCYIRDPFGTTYNLWEDPEAFK
jgi:catechol 2,3-dioxygenase-like lactoylglutathione lyase family enzyme